MEQKKNTTFIEKETEEREAKATVQDFVQQIVNLSNSLTGAEIETLDD